jgi:hypothetical protein
MKELLEYRKQLTARLVSASKEFQDACLALNDPFEPLDSSWNAHQLAAHTRDVHKLVYGLRALQTSREDNPEFQNFDGDAYMAKHYSADESLDDLLNGFVADVRDVTETLNALPVEAWSRVSRHATLGSGFTLQSWVERDLAHIEEHLATVKKGK